MQTTAKYCIPNGGEVRWEGGGMGSWCIEPVVSWNNRRDSLQMVSLKYSIHRKMLFAPGQSESNLVYSSLPPSLPHSPQLVGVHSHTCTRVLWRANSEALLSFSSPPRPLSPWVCQNETTCVVWMHAILTRLTLHYSAN